MVLALAIQHYLQVVNNGSSGSTLLRSKNLASLRSLQISNCFKLQVLVDELLRVEPCKVEVSNCPGLREWCLQHGINYKEQIIHYGRNNRSDKTLIPVIVNCDNRKEVEIGITASAPQKQSHISAPQK